VDDFSVSRISLLTTPLITHERLSTSIASDVLAGTSNMWVAGRFDDNAIGLDESSETPPDINARSLRLRPLESERPISVAHIATKADWVLAISDKGLLYSWGSDADGVYGDATSNEQRKRPTTTPHKVNCLCAAREHRLRAVAVGSAHAAVLTESGLVYWYVLNPQHYTDTVCITHMHHIHFPTHAPLLVPRTRTRTRASVAKSCAQRYECSWGDHMDGQLGVGRLSSAKGSQQWQRVDVPCLLPLRPTVGSIAMGGAHSLALTDSGHVYSWGRAKNGRLGHGDSDSAAVHTPRVLRALIDRRVSNR
jgi:alpha-tubulin suppressor-like RCC1 family protein